MQKYTGWPIENVKQRKIVKIPIPVYVKNVAIQQSHSFSPLHHKFHWSDNFQVSQQFDYLIEPIMEQKIINDDRPRIVISGPKPRRRRLRVSDPDFQPPDGGWGWLIVFACGFSNVPANCLVKINDCTNQTFIKFQLSTFPMFQQFGLVFKARLSQLQITRAETTAIINMNSAFNAGMGKI